MSNLEILTDEYYVEDGETRLLKRSEMQCVVPLDLTACTILGVDVSGSVLTDEELGVEEQKLLNLLGERK